MITRPRKKLIGTATVNELNNLKKLHCALSDFLIETSQGHKTDEFANKKEFEKISKFAAVL